ncbi:MAG: hypothetical protein QXX52_08140 [Ignisphaera sp.]
MYSRMNAFVNQAIGLSIYTFTMCVSASTIVLIIGAIANGILSALGYLHEAGVIEFGQRGKAGERKK